MMLRFVKRAGYAGRPTVDGRKRRSAHIELGKLVELDVDFILRAALALCFDFLGLAGSLAHRRCKHYGKKLPRYLVQHLG